MINQKNLSKLSNRILREEGGLRVSENVLERDYCISWLLNELSVSELGKPLLFKGGTSIKKCYIIDYRFSEDLDFTADSEFSKELFSEQLAVVFNQIQKTSNIRFQLNSLDFVEHDKGFTCFLGYQGPMQRSRQSRLKMDITTKELVYYPPEHRQILGYKEYEDLPRDRKLRVYSIEEILAEKTMALLDYARNEPRDLYDLWYLTGNGYASIGDVIPAIEKKLGFRGLKLDNTRQKLDGKQNRLAERWETSLKHQMNNLPEFDGVFRAVKRDLRQAQVI